MTAKFSQHLELSFKKICRMIYDNNFLLDNLFVLAYHKRFKSESEITQEEAQGPRASSIHTHTNVIW